MSVRWKVPLGLVVTGAVAVAVGAVAVATGVVTPGTGPSTARPAKRKVQAQAPAPVPQLVTNEYAYHHQNAGDAIRSPDWVVTSGSLFRVGDMLWSGRPDDVAPGPSSELATGSAVFRAVTTRDDYADVKVSFALRVAGMTTTGRTPAQEFDGVHVFLRYQSEEAMYSVSIRRRDGQLIFKRKTPGGPSNGGTYTTLASGRLPSEVIEFGGWQHIEATVVRCDGNAVRLVLRIDGHLELDVVDRGVSGAPIASAGRIGVRGDNCDFYIKDFRIEPADVM